jgi:glycosyltransferase involved in cell wall biosynthesis
MFEQYPAATVVVLAYRSADTIVAVLQGLGAQDIGEPFQIIVVASGGDATVDIVRRMFPEVELIATGRRLTPGAGRNAGVAVARSQIVAFLADDCVPAPDWLRRRVAEHRGGHQLVSGFIDTIEPTSWAGYAQYFAKFWGLQRLRDVRLVGRGPLFHLSYDRALLNASFDEDCIAGEDTVFNDALVRDGHRVLFDGAIRVSHVNDLRFGDVLAGQREQGLATGEACRRYGLDSYYVPSARGGPWMPVVQWARALRAVTVFRRSMLLRFLLVSPLVVVASAVRRHAFRDGLRGRGEVRPPAPGGDVRRVAPTKVQHIDISVVVPAFNEEAAIRACLDSLLAQTADALEIIVVDDGSTDRTVERSRSRGVRVLSVPHAGPALAKNTGVAAAVGRAIVFVDADLILDPKCIELLCAPILAGAAVGTFTKDIVVANPDNAWADCWTRNRWAARGEHFPAGMPDRWDNFRAVDRAAFMAVGGYDDVGYGEDMTLAPKLHVSATAVPGARMRHRHPDSLREIWGNARWVGRGVRIRERPGVASRYSAWRSLRRGIAGARALGRPRYVLFALIYDFGVLSSYIETRLGRRLHAK